MKKYELRKKNALGNSFVALFMDMKLLNKFVDDNQLPSKYRYYVVVEETKRVRVDINSHIYT